MLYQAPFGLENIAIVNDGADDKVWLCGSAGVIAKKDEIVNTHQTQDRHSISLYPNPLTNQTLYIQGLDDATSRIDIKVYDLAAKMIFSKTNHPTQEPILLDKLKDGMYLVRVIDGNSRTAHLRKLLIINAK